MKRYVLVVAILCALLFNSQFAFAGDGSGGGGGNGDGSGGGNGSGGNSSVTESSLSLDIIQVEDDLDHVAPDETIILTFSNNVVNMKVKENNMASFSVKDSSGQEAEFEVFMGDDQLDPSIKRIIEIRPKSTWKEGTTYTIHISKSLSSKKGDTLAEAQSIEFTTTGVSESDGMQLILIGLVAVILIAGGVLIVRGKKN